MRKQKKGTTLVEVMIYSFLIGVVLSGVYGILIFSLRYYKTVDEMTTMQQDAMIAMSRTGEFLNDSKAEYVTIAPISGFHEPLFVGVMFPSPKNQDNEYLFNDEGKIMWQKWICYYPERQKDGTVYLIAKEDLMFQPVEKPVKQSAEQLAIFTKKTNVTSRRVIAKNISSFKVAQIMAGSPVFEIKLAVDGPTYKNKPNTIELKTQIMLRN
jgi:hypothetical protein